MDKDQKRRYNAAWQARNKAHVAAKRREKIAHCIERGICVYCQRRKGTHYKIRKVCAVCWERHKRWRSARSKAPEGRARARKYLELLKAEVVQGYGGRCTCCGESNAKFLTLDHVNDNGRDYGRNRSTKEVRRARSELRAGRTSEFTVLCFNCNCGRHRNGGKCPHEDSAPRKAK